jgi:hypothetical protein
MLQAIAEKVGAKVLTAVVVFGLACAGFWFYKHPDDLASLWSVIKYTLAWLAFVAIFPWAMFMVTRRVVSLESNTAAGIMLAGYLLMDVLAGLYLAGGVGGHSVLTWMVMVAGFLAAGVYNFLVCEFVAERLENA